MSTRSRLSALAAALTCTALALPAQATFSIVAADPAAGAIGSAGASCVPYQVIRILRVAKGRGLLVGQANFDDDALAEAEALLADGEEPAAVLGVITDATVFPNAPKMQYGIVDTEGRTASITGPEAKPFAADLPGSSGPVHFTVQGNLLTGAAVLDGMAAAAAHGCDLPERLVQALEAAGTGGGGDARCTDGGISAASAYLLVAWNDGAELRISLPDVRPEDPMVALRTAFDGWRAKHPCPVAEPDPEPIDLPDLPGGEGASTSGCALSPAPAPPPGGGLSWWCGLALLAVLRCWKSASKSRSPGAVRR